MRRKLGEDFYGVIMIDNRYSVMTKNPITASTAQHYDIYRTSFSEVLVQWKLAEFHQKSDEKLQHIPSFVPMSPLHIDETFNADVSLFYKFDSFYMKKVTFN